MDRLSSLPGEVISHIISFLPVRQMIRTSILSTRWRYLFASTTGLTIDYDVDDWNIYSFGFNVNKVLLSRRSTTIEKFCLKLKITCCVDRSRVGHLTHFVDGWMCYPLSHDVQELELCLPEEIKFNHLPSTSMLFNCETLVSLKLKFVTLEVPDTIRMPKLKILHLEEIDFSYGKPVRWGWLFSGSSALEEMLVQCCKWGFTRQFSVSSPTLKRLILKRVICEELVIDAPSLVYFKHLDSAANYYSLLNLQSLVEAFIDIWPIKSTFCYKTAATDLLRGMSNVRSLHIGNMFTTASGLYNVPEFPNLTYLKINTSFSHDWHGILCRFPHLETLVIDLEPSSSEKHILPKRNPSYMLSHLKEIEICSFHGLKHELQLVEYFLKNARFIQNLTVNVGKQNRLSSRVTKALQKLARDSKKCNVMIV
ncbi:hypothetical protein PTKIN_Ptkin14bG0055400 [Pterospermum kingtungense]